MELDDFVTKKLTDIGTRYQHYAELLDHWETGLEVIRNRDNSSTLHKAQLLKLETVTEFMRKQMEIMSGYDHSRITLWRQVEDASNAKIKPWNDKADKHQDIG